MRDALPDCATPRFSFLISASHTKDLISDLSSPNTPAYLCGMRFQTAPRPEITTLVLKLIFKFTLFMTIKSSYKIAFAIL
jgi:hypothetical protein